MTTVLLIRHGRTDANARGILAGRAPGVVLDATGRRQARALGTKLRDVPLAAVVHSPLERCAQTVDALLDRRTGDAVPRHVDDRLAECDYGSWSGRALLDLANEPLWTQVQRTPSEVTFPAGESMRAMADRAVAAVRFWVAEHPDGTVAVVSHGDLIKAILSDALAQPFDEFQRIAVSPGSVSTVVYVGERPMVVGVNDVALRGRQAPPQPTVGGGAG